MRPALTPERHDISKPDLSERPSKRPSTDKSRAAMSYPRKRAVTACQLCRTRKTKCSNTRPKCKLCADIGNNCVYEDPLDHSSFDPASLLMLERLNQILDRLDNPSTNLPIKSTYEAFAARNGQQCGVSPVSLSSGVYEPEPVEMPDEDYMKIPSSRGSCDAILMWPIFENRYPPNFLIAPLLAAGAESESEDESDIDSPRPTSRRRGSGVGNSFSSGAIEDNVLQLVETFLAFVHTKNPILDVATLRQYARRIAEEGARWDGKSCLVLLACALGSIVKPYAETWCESSKAALNNSDDSKTHAMRDLGIAEHYYRLARKRIGLLGGSIIRSQCYLLSGVYLMYALRPLEAWQNFLQASTTYHVYLKGRMQRVEVENEFPSKTRRLEQRLYWSCFKSECEIRVELSLPESSIANIRHPDMFPSPPNEPDYSEMAHLSPSINTSTYNQRTVDSMDENQQQSWYYYLTEIALRRIGNRVLHALYTEETELAIPELIRITADFESQLHNWQTMLPQMLNYNRDNLRIIPTDELPYMTRARMLDIKLWLYQPTLYYAIHHSADDPYQRLMRPFVEKALEANTCFIRGMNVRHRHHGTWFGMRTSTRAAFAIIAAVKCGHITLPEDWCDTIEIQIAMLRYWEKESLDLAKARLVLQEMLSEILSRA